MPRQEDQAGDDADHDRGALGGGSMPTLGELDQRREQRKRVRVAVGRVVGRVVVEVRSKEERNDGEVRDAIREVPAQHAPQDEESGDGPGQAGEARRVLIVEREAVGRQVGPVRQRVGGEKERRLQHGDANRMRDSPIVSCAATG